MDVHTWLKRRAEEFNDSVFSRNASWDGSRVYTCGKMLYMQSWEVSQLYRIQLGPKVFG